MALVGKLSLPHALDEYHEYPLLSQLKYHHRSRQIHFKAEATTAIKKQVEAKIPEKVRQVVKPIRAVNLQLIKNNKVNYKVRVRH